MTYALGKTSIARLDGVHPSLVRCVERAIALSAQDFTLLEGLRTPERQQQLVAKGASRTLNSKHIRQADGFGHAVDLVPWEGGPRWEWPLIYPVAFAMQSAAGELGVRLTWGGVWDRELAQLGGTAADIAHAVAAYCARHPGPDFIDGPHYQLAA